MHIGIFCLSGYNPRAVVALCRDSAARGLPIHLAARGPDDPILRTAHADRVFVRREAEALTIEQLCAWITALRRLHGYAWVLIAPSTEFFNRYALRHRAALEAAGGLLPLVDEALYARISDKQSFGAMCQAHGLQIPADSATPPAERPFVAKPIRYASASGRQLKPHLIHDAADWAHFCREEDAADFYYQAFVTGRSLYLLMHLARDGQATTYAQENLVQQRQGGSIILARRSDFHHEAEAGRYIHMLRREGFHGLIMIELREDPAGRCVMIEANPRMWGPQQFPLDNGVDLFGALWRDTLRGQLGDAAAAAAVPPWLQAVAADTMPWYYWSGGLVPASQPYAFHHYDPATFMDDHAALSACDLFERADTRELFLHERQP